MKLVHLHLEILAKKKCVLSSNFLPKFTYEKETMTNMNKITWYKNQNRTNSDTKTKIGRTLIVIVVLLWISKFQRVGHNLLECFGPKLDLFRWLLLKKKNLKFLLQSTFLALWCSSLIPGVQIDQVLTTGFLRVNFYFHWWP